MTDHLAVVFAMLGPGGRRFADPESWARLEAEIGTELPRDYEEFIDEYAPALRQFTLANSHHPNHTVQTRALHAYLRWRNQNARHPDVLAAQRRERARIRSERGLRWGGRPMLAAA